MLFSVSVGLPCAGGKLVWIAVAGVLGRAGVGA